jgi:hypothetical protein
VVSTGNPFTTDGNGAYGFAALDGIYDVHVQGSGPTTILNGVNLTTTAAGPGADYITRDAAVTAAFQAADAAISASIGIGQGSIVSGYQAGDVAVTNVFQAADVVVTNAYIAADLADRNALAADSGSSLVGYLAPYTGAVARTQASKDSDVVSPEDFGAVGNGIADDTIAVQAAITTGSNVKGTSGHIYLIDGGVSASTVGQVLDWTGCTIKLKDSASSKYMLVMAGDSQTSIGGAWNGNKAGSNIPGDLYTSAAVRATANKCSVIGAIVSNVAGIGVKGDSTVNDMLVKDCNISGTTLYGIFIDGPTGSSRYRNRAIGNTVDGSLLTQVGILFAGDGSYAGGFGQYDFDVSGNVCNLPVATTDLPICISVRGHRGNFENNRTVGGSMGISEGGDDSVFIGNNISNTAGTSSFGIEPTGKRCVVSGNRISGVKCGVSATTNAPDDLVVTGNYISASVSGVDLRVGKNGTVSGNTIRSVIGVTTTGDITGLNVSGNRLIGPGSGTVNAYPVRLDSPATAAYATCNNNVCSGFYRPFAVYNAGAVAHTNLTAIGNDLSSDVAGSTNGWWFYGSATVGAKVCLKGGVDVNGSDKDIHDQLLNIFTLYSNSYSTPESFLIAGIGSIYNSLVSGGGSFYKKIGANTNTGWIAAS